MQPNKTDHSTESHREHFQKLQTFLDQYDLKRGKSKPPTPQEREEFETRFRHFVRSGKSPT